ncbi:GNAT family N-acetyltransferase [Paenibacillus hemerocallicola]|uniref:GNAT family N-acetyltransferase n=1 Tax=Paenibacillus hemerocallicola TaxID=1172614 RepID=A0A5C4TCC4_9BACL|nr:GNAT family N-acetyltransferase [Paenibacillus hemerocallicola]TNJ66754.1 GNAT family N-acetyltransferase [Paenibacillus hemerocallicola]
MKENSKEKAVTFQDLKWDTDFFGVTSAKAVLHRALTLSEWDELRNRLRDYQFISIENRNSEPVNAQLIGKGTTAFLADVNIQFVKKLKFVHEVPRNITIHQSLEKNNLITELADFQFSKFTEDLELAKRGGDQVYRHWIINSFDNPDKFYALSRDDNNEINGFLLHSYDGDTCVIELIAVAQAVTKNGVGTSLFKAVENATYLRGFSEIRVGTQVRNMSAINFYHKVGCKQAGCHQVYHYWVENDDG